MLTLNSVESARLAAGCCGTGGAGGTCLSGNGVSSFLTRFEGLLGIDCGLPISPPAVKNNVESVGPTGLAGTVLSTGFGATGIGSIVAGLSNFGVLPSSSKTVAVLKTLVALGGLY